MSGRPRSDAQLANDKRKKNARNTLSQRGYRNMINGKSMSAALAKHRLQGKSNDEFFAALNASLAQRVGVATAAAADVPAPAAAVAVAPNATAKKARTPAQAAANQRRRNAIAALKAQGHKANSASVKRYLNGQLASGAAAAAPSLVKDEILVEELETNNAGASGATGAAGIVPSVAAAQVLAPAPAKKPTLSHSEAGKKAASSAKGAAWLEKIATTRRNVNKNFSNAGLTVRAPQANITKIASLRYTKKNTNAANRHTEEIIARAQSKAFNKANKATKNSSRKAANKTVRKSTKKRNNSLNRAVRNFVNRRNARITRKKQSKYGTFNASRRIPRENVNNRFQGSPNNFNIEELRNRPMNNGSNEEA
jgi:hypothetical protein